MKQSIQKSPLSPAIFRLAFFGTLILFAAHMSVITALPLRTDLRIAIHDVMVVIEGALASAALFYAAKRSARHSRRLGLAWMLLAIATLSYMIGDAIWTVIEVVQGQSDLFPSLADAGYLPYYFVFIMGILLLPTKRLGRDEGIKLLLDMGVVMIASVLVYRTFLFAPIIQQATDTLTLSFTLAYPALDLVLLWGVIFVLLRQTQQQSGPLLLLASSALCLAFADSFFNFQAISGIYQSGASFTDPIYVASLLLAALAGVLQGATQGTIQDTEKERTEEKVRYPKKIQGYSGHAERTVYLALPYLWVAIAYGLLIWEHNHFMGDISSDFVLVAFGVGLIIVLVLIRQLITMNENEQLSADLARLLDASYILASPIEFNQLSRLIRSELKRLVDFEFVSLWTLQDKTTLLSVQDGETIDAGHTEHPQKSIKLGLTAPIAALLEAGHPTLAPQRASPLDGNSPVHTLLFPATATDSPDPYRSKSIGSWIVAPLVTNNRKIGVLVVGHTQPHAFTQSHVQLLAAFANQVAAAIENAQLRKQEAAAAAAAERARLARELHDSVSQALFGILLGARTTRQLIPSQPDNALTSTDYVLSLTEGALAEMRALIFELRPENLMTEGLVVALQKQVTALCKRHNLDARIVALPGEPNTNIEIKEALYRIGLEAIQNTIKHAQASQVEVNLISNQTEVILEVRDNGRGFDVTASHEGHYGLISMRERAERCGATFDAESQLGHGTTVRVSVPNPTPA